MTQLLDAWDYFIGLATILVPLFIGGTFLVGLAQEYLPPERVERVLRKYDGGRGNVIAAGVGAITPFCSCSTIPILAGLLQAGTPLGTAFSFLLASPIVNWIAIALLIGIVGFELTAIYVVSTLLAAVLTGILIGRLELGHHIKDIQLGSSHTVATDGGTPSNFSRSHSKRFKAAGYGAWGFFVDMLPYLLLGMVLGAFIHGIVPKGVIQSVLGTSNPVAVVFAAIIGAPIYISMSAMLPIAAAFIDQGILIGTVLAFVVGSAGVSIPNLIILNKLFDRKLLVLYASCVVAIAVVIGLLLNLLV